MKGSAAGVTSWAGRPHETPRESEPSMGPRRGESLAEASPYPRVAVLVPTYRRPAYLARCLRALFRQTYPPHLIVVVVRPDDEESHAVVRQFVGREETSSHARRGEIEIREVGVTLSGPVWAFKRGIEFLRARPDVDLIFVTDDDAEPEEEWIERGCRHFFDPSVGIVAGRVLPYRGEHLIERPPVKAVGRVTWYGRFVGGFDRVRADRGLEEVHGFQGCNVAMRRDLASRLVVDTNFIGYGIQFELDIAFQARRMGYRILFDPSLRVRHFEAPRAEPFESRQGDAHLIYSYSHNHTYVILKHFPLMKKLAFLAYFFLRGEMHSWGILRIVGETILRRSLAWCGQVGVSFRGKWEGIRTYWRSRSESRACRARIPLRNC